MYIIMKMMVVYYLSNKERVVSMDLSEERNEERFQWIRNDIEFDFPIPTILKNTIEEIEEADRTGDMVEYNSLADCIHKLNDKLRNKSIQMGRFIFFAFRCPKMMS